MACTSACLLVNVALAAAFGAHVWYMASHNTLPEPIRNQTCCPTEHWGPNDSCCDYDDWYNVWYDNVEKTNCTPQTDGRAGARQCLCARSYDGVGITNIGDSILAQRYLVAIILFFLMLVPYHREANGWTINDSGEMEGECRPFTAIATSIDFVAAVALWLTGNILIWHSINLHDCRHPDTWPIELLHHHLPYDFALGVIAAGLVPAVIGLAIVGILIACLAEAWCGDDLPGNHPSDTSTNPPTEPPTEQSALVIGTDPAPLTAANSKTASGPPPAPPPTTPAPPPYNSTQDSTTVEAEV